MQEYVDKRYKEPKKIGDILNDMGMGKDDIAYKKPLSKSSKKFADTLVKNLVAYHKLIEKIDIEHLHLVGVIATMEDFYDEEKNTLTLYKMLMAKEQIQSASIKTSTHNAQVKLETFCRITASLCKNLKKLVEKISYQEDRDIQDKRIDDFLLFFREECHDITDIIADQLKLVKTLDNT